MRGRSRTRGPERGERRHAYSSIAYIAWRHARVRIRRKFLKHAERCCAVPLPRPPVLVCDYHEDGLIETQRAVLGRDTY